MTATDRLPTPALQTARIMYICEVCAESYPEGCGHYDRTDLAVMPDGRWLCEICFDDDDARLACSPPGEPDEPLRWRDMPHPPEYAPVIGVPATSESLATGD